MSDGWFGDYDDGMVHPERRSRSWYSDPHGFSDTAARAGRPHLSRRPPDFTKAVVPDEGASRRSARRPLLGRLAQLVLGSEQRSVGGSQ
jgi:hypothetical protein